MNYQHIRNATAIIEFAGTKFLIDPFLSPKGSLPSVPSKYNDLNNPIIDLPCSIDEIIADIDAVIVTHMHHFDHFDNVAKEVLDKNIPIYTQNEVEQRDMQALGFTVVNVLLDDGVLFNGISLYRTDAEHGDKIHAQKFYDAKNIPSDASGVVLVHPNEETLYLSGDTLWNASIEQTIQKFNPKTIVLNAGAAEFADDAPILMGAEGIFNARKISLTANIIVVHLEAVNHARLTRKDVHQFINRHGITENIFIPNDGEMINGL